MSMCQPRSPPGSFIHTWSQSETLGHNIDIEGGVGQAKLSGSGKGEGLPIQDYQGVQYIYCWKSD